MSKEVSAPSFSNHLITDLEHMFSQKTSKKMSYVCGFLNTKRYLLRAQQLRSFLNTRSNTLGAQLSEELGKKEMVFFQRYRRDR
jgi:hypothetical protein